MSFETENYIFSINFSRLIARKTGEATYPNTWVKEICFCVTGREVLSTEMSNLRLFVKFYIFKPNDLSRCYILEKENDN